MGSQGSRDVRPDGLKVVASVNSSACRREFGTTSLHTKISQECVYCILGLLWFRPEAVKAGKIVRSFMENGVSFFHADLTTDEKSFKET